MEALVALGVAGNVVQFVDFGFKLFAKTNEIRQMGATFEIVDLEIINSSINVLAQNIRSSLETYEATCLTETDHHLDRVAEVALDIAGDLRTALSRLKSEPDKGRWKSFVHALKVSWSGEKAEKLFERLLRLRDQLEIQVLLKMKHDADINQAVNSSKFSTLSENLQLIGRDIVEGNRFFTTTLDTQFQQLMEAHKVTKELAEFRHQETLAAIRQIGNESEREHITHVKKLSQKELEELREDKRPVAEREFLKNIDFTQKHQRENEVAEAHHKTFKWLFGNDSNDTLDLGSNSVDDKTKSTRIYTQNSMKTFLNWLSHGSGCFWINGKAASGKSTLMRHLHRHEELKARLRIWACASSLHIASFFFFNAGTDLQKKQEGLLRAILHSILAKRPSLVSQYFATFIDEALENIQHRYDSIRVDTPTIADLRRGFAKLVESDSHGLKIFLIVDGVDEYVGDVGELCELFQRVTSNSCCKMLLSSRPIPVCIEAFQSCPTFKLQELTRPDILAYVRDKLEGHSRLQQLRTEFPLEVERLVHSIGERASGVFLWVILVTRSLLNGLNNYDTVEDLELRLNAYPRELHGLYKHMIQGMDEFHRSQASQLFQIVYQRLRVRHTRPLDVLQLCYDSEPPRNALTANNPSRNLKTWRRDMEGRLRSRCCGLIEVDHTVQFLHKTVVDFLEESEIWDFVLYLCNDKFFDVNTNIVASSICRIKAEPTPKCLDTRASQIMVYVKDCLYYARRAETMAQRPQTLYLRELDQAMTKHWSQAQYWMRDKNMDPNSIAVVLDNVRQISPLKDTVWDYLPTIGSWTIAIEYVGRLPNHEETFASLAVAFDLNLFIRDLLHSSARKDIFGQSLGRQLPQQVILCLLSGKYSDFNAKFTTLSTLLECGVDPRDAWDLLVQQIANMIDESPFDNYEKWTRVVEVFCKAGVDVNLAVSRKGNDNALTLLTIITLALDQTEFEDNAFKQLKYEDGSSYKIRVACGHTECAGYSRCMQDIARNIMHNRNASLSHMAELLKSHGALAKTFPAIVYDARGNRVVHRAINDHVSGSDRQEHKEHDTNPQPISDVSPIVEVPIISVDHPDLRDGQPMLVETYSTYNVSNSLDKGPIIHSNVETLLSPPTSNANGTKITNQSPTLSKTKSTPEIPNLRRARSMRGTFDRIWHRRSASTHSTQT